MSRKPPDEMSTGSAEANYRDAFMRLKNNTPLRLTKGAKASQNNVAKEAGCDPSALRKSRFPTLIKEIQDHNHPAQLAKTSARQKASKQRDVNRSLKERLADATKQRDQMASLLNTANEVILALTDQLNAIELRSTPQNVSLLSNRKKPK